MFVEERTGNGVGAECSLLVPSEKGASFNGHSIGNGSENTEGNLGASSVDGLHTYKRRKHLRPISEGNLQENARVSVASAGQIADKKIEQPQGVDLHNNSYEKNDFSRIDGPLCLQDSEDCLNDHWRNVVLEHISESLGASEGGIQSCIKDATASSFSKMVELNGVSEKTVRAQESVECLADGRKCHSQLLKLKISASSQNAAEEGITSDGSCNDPNKHVNTELCQRVFRDVIVSEKFALLCKLLCENFQGIKVDSFFDFSVINSRMKEGLYEQSPVLFSADMQQVWRKFQKIGSEMVFLAKGLSDMSRASYHDQVGGLENGISGEGKHVDCLGLVTRKQYSSLGADQHAKREQAEVYGLDKVCSCRRCGAKANGKDYLVCDSCEEMYHVSCIDPAVEEIPPRSWYCANCTTSGIESPHENCVVCERLNDPKISRPLVCGDGTEPMTKEMLSDVEEESDCCMEAEVALPSFSGKVILRTCKICGEEEDNGQKFRTCGHPHCPNKFYHVKCLTVEQLKTYSFQWYCPSCLCRACLTDKDDEKIVLCDGCDHAYHIYCMEPPRTSIPRGKWFCKQCDKGIQAIIKARKAYENLQKQQKNSSGGTNTAAGSMDMLLSAAEKLKSEEGLATIKGKR